VWGRSVLACAQVSLASDLALLFCEEARPSLWREVILNFVAVVFQATAEKATFDEYCMAFVLLVCFEFADKNAQMAMMGRIAIGRYKEIAAESEEEIMDEGKRAAM
jgi:hypothetical protein